MTLHYNISKVFQTKTHMNKIMDAIDKNQIHKSTFVNNAVMFSQTT